MCYVLHLLYYNAKIKIHQFAMLLVVGTAITALSFAVSKAVKFSFYFPNMSNTEIVEIATHFLAEQETSEILSEITARFNGFDGQLKYLSIQGPKYSKKSIRT